MPTQIVTEFVRHELLDGDGARVLGIRYASAARARGVSWVMFVDAGGCVTQGPGWNDVPAHWLGLEPASLRHFAPSWREDP